ncbi:hypothetical protein MGYG_08706 [Nannizzia gypsea CBS 118893]|uniref:Uncharacterized protein n=1 Tax=Arthroderma gypseum (strain ATCC MYA-4604 / CBS 118893) TaxID=535722 RepID=E4V6R5_ARTGP|nr:hypothetical protein MGYG_08706 [Nannizzia gypsea CBS 118893]EFQ96781.1 hypothetical protein MGYG_08706 [Nannizzia gypsea CBS 118893]
MLDENLPTFFVKPSSEAPKSRSTLFVAQHGKEPQPAYTVRHLDPELQTSRNRYAVALYDSFCPDALYGEVLIIPKWTHPTFSQEAIRANGGVQPPPEPIMPTEFIIQLYNPEQQVLVRHKPKTWNTPATWAFEMPQRTFREPSKSQLDKTITTPATSDATSRLRFNWRKDGRMGSKDLGCYLSGKVVGPSGNSKKNREPDITVAIFSALKEITLYEPNFSRVEMEDYKGLEIVLMLGAIVIRDVFFSPMKEAFNILNPPLNSASPINKPSSTPVPSRPLNGAAGYPPAIRPPPASHPPAKPLPQQPQQRPAPPPRQSIPPTDLRSQWELDAEANVLKQQSEAEKRARLKKEKEAEKRTKKLLEAEEKEAKKRQAQVDKETERLRKIYGKGEIKVLKLQQQHQPAPRPPQPPRQPQNHPVPPQSRVQFAAPRPQSIAGGLRPPPQQQPQPQLKEKRSIFGFRKKESGVAPNTLMKKRSSMF